MSDYRVKLDLTAFYSDYRRHSYILVKRDWSTVNEMKEHVEKTFKLAHVEFLTSDEVYLPNFESIDIINLNDEIKAIPGGEVPLSQPKRKKFKKSKSDVEEDSKDEGPMARDEGKGGLIADDADSDLKSKRKRKRKRKTKDGSSASKETTSVPRSSVPVKKLSRKAADGNGTVHIVFDDDGNAVDSNTMDISFVNYLDSQDSMKARIVRATVNIICNEQRNGVDKEDEKHEEEKNCIPTIKLIAA